MGQAVYRFSRFTVDSGAHALFKDGARVPLQEQPFQVLLALVENPGQVVTRETLRLRLWGTDTFVDFDQSLNSALRRLRLALEDNSRDPQLVETIPRTGFRFLPEVSTEYDFHVSGFLAGAAASGLAGNTLPPSPRFAAVNAQTKRRFPGAAGAIASITFLLGVLFGLLPSQWRRIAEPEQVAAASRGAQERGTPPGTRSVESSACGVSARSTSGAPPRSDR